MLQMPLFNIDLLCADCVLFVQSTSSLSRILPSQPWECTAHVAVTTKSSLVLTKLLHMDCGEKIAFKTKQNKTFKVNSNCEPGQEH